jgi:hypothetical protein
MHNSQHLMLDLGVPVMVPVGAFNLASWHSGFTQVAVPVGHHSPKPRGDLRVKLAQKQLLGWLTFGRVYGVANGRNVSRQAHRGAEGQ